MTETSGGRRTRVAGVGCTLAVALMVSACSSDDGAEAEDISTQTSFPTSDVREVADPCEAVEVEEVATLVGVEAVEAAPDGAAEYRGCSYTDSATDVVVVTTTVYASDADFEQVWDSVASSITAETVEVEVNGADGARLIVAEEEGSLAISGVAAANGVVDQVNLLVEAPFDRAAQEAAATTLLERLVAQAAEG